MYNYNVMARHVTGLTIAFLLSVSQLTSAAELDWGNWQGSWDTTLSYGQGYRLSDVDTDIVAISNAGTIGPTGTIGFPVTGGITGNAASANFDDGNTNFQSGIFSHTTRFVTELDLAHKKGYGIFTRLIGFKDFENDDLLDRGTPLADKSARLATSNLILRDAYAWIDLDVADMPLNIRVGEQVISWGESTFIQNSINVINPFDVTRLRTPGAELREGLIPVGALFASLAVTQDVTVEAYYQYDWEQFELEGAGSYFSTNDFATPGGNRVQLGSGAVSDRGSLNPALATPANLLSGAAFDPTFASVFRGADVVPDDGGEFGAALRWFLPNLNGTELGFYYINYNARTPVINVTTGSAAGVGAGGAAAAATAGNAATLIGLVGFAPGDIASLAGLSAIDAYADSANYFLEYRENIDLFGLSFNTEIGQTGIALQGEYSFRQDMPLQIDDAELLAAGLAPLAPVLGFTPASQLGSFATDTVIPGYINRNVSQVQMTATKLFGPVLKADQAVLVGEFAITHVHGMPEKETLRLEAPGTFTGGNALLTAQGLQPFTESNENFADATSWGYQIRGRMDYLNAIGPINVSPRFAWRHDVSGIAPVGLSGFREDSKAISLGVNASYINQWFLDMSYTNFFGAGQYNLLNDRDFFAFNLSRLF